VNVGSRTAVLNTLLASLPLRGADAGQWLDHGQHDLSTVTWLSDRHRAADAALSFNPER
jgi:hypothetical protein